MTAKTAEMRPHRKKISAGSVLIFLFCLVSAALMVIPFLWMVSASFKLNKEIFTYDATFFPRQLHTVNYETVWGDIPFLQYFLNTAKLAVIITMIQLVTCSLAAFSFSKLHYPGRDKLFLAYLATMMVPWHAIMIPQFIIVRSLGLYDTIWGSAICYLSAPMGVFLAKQFYLTFPRELDEAAALDGCSKFGTYMRVYLPLSTTIIATLTITKGTQVWNDFFYPLIMTTSQRNNTLQLCLQLFKGSSTTHFNWLMAAATATSLPMVILYFSAQKYFVEGLQTTGMKN